MDSSSSGKQRDSYLELVMEFPLTSIRSDEHLQAAQAMLDALLT
jgi:HTH-type transcriptional regulator / antitoxin HigA